MKGSIIKRVCLLLTLSLLFSATAFVGNGLADTEPDWVVRIRSLCYDLDGFNIEATTTSGSALKLTQDDKTVDIIGINDYTAEISDGNSSQIVDLSDNTQFYDMLEGFGFDCTPVGKTAARFLCDDVGIAVEWDYATNATTLSKDGKTALVSNNRDGTATISSDGRQETIYWVIVTGRSYVDDFEFFSVLEGFGFDCTPVGKTAARFLCDDVGITIEWDYATNATTLSKDGKTALVSNNRDGTATISCDGRQETIYWVVVMGRAYVDDFEFFSVLEGFGFDFTPEGKTVLRSLCDEAGIIVGWNSATKATTLSKDGRTASATNLNDGTARISYGNSSKTVYWVIIANRTYVDQAEFISALQTIGLLTSSTNNNGGNGNNNINNNGGNSNNNGNNNNDTGSNGTVANTTAATNIIATVSSGNGIVDSTQTNKLISNAINNKETSMTILLPNNVVSAKFEITDINLMKENNVSLSISKEGVTFTIPSQNLKEYVPADAKQVTLSVKPVAFEVISDLEKNNVAKDSIKAVFDLEFIVDNKKITDFSTKPLTVSISANNFNFKSSDKLTGFRISDNLSLVPLGGSFNPKTNCFEFVTDHLSSYGVMTYEKLTSIVFTVENNRYSLNGKAIINDAVPFIDSKNYTLVPLRTIAESLGAKVDWSDLTQTVTITMDGKEIKLTIGVLTNGMSTPAIIQNGRTMVPLRYVSENLGASVVWDGSTKTVAIYKMN